MSTLAKLLVSLGLDSGEYTKGLADSAQETDSFAKSLLSVGTVAVAASAVAGAALVGVGIAGLKAFASFETGMSEVFTLLPGISQDAMGAMTTDVKNFSKEFGVLPEQTIPALYQALSAGVPKDNVFEFLEVAQKAAVGGVTSLETAVDGITSVINAYGTDIVSASKASDLMFTTVKLGKTNFEQLSQSLFNVIPTAASLGVSFEDVSAAMASMTLQGTPTSVATTQLRSALVEASKGGTNLSKALVALTGKSFPQLIAGGMDIGTIFNTLRSSMPEQEFKDLFGSVEALNAVLGITGPNAKLFQSNLDAMKGSTGATDMAFQVMNQTLGMSMNKLKAFAAVFLVDIGQHLAPAVALFATALIALLNSAFVTDMINNLGIAIAATVQWLILASTTGIPQLNAGFATLMGVLAPIIGYFSSIAADGDVMNDWLTHFPTVLQPVIAVLGNYLVMWGSVATTIANVVSYLIGGDLAGAWQALITGLGGVVTSYTTYISSLYALLSGVGTWLATNLPLWGAAFVAWIEPYIPVALAMLNTFIASVGAWIVAQAPILIGMFVSWGLGLGAWIAPYVPIAIAALVAFGQQVLAWIGAQAASLLTAFSAWAASLWSWVPQAIVDFLAAWPGLLTAWLDWIASVVGPLLAQLGTWAVAFIAWIVPMIPDMIVAAGGIIAAMLVFIGQTAVVLIGKLVEWGAAFLGWIATEVLPKLPGMLASIDAAIGVWINTATTWVKGQIVRIGTAIIDGIKSGISAAWGSLVSYLTGQMSGLVNAAMSAIGAHSPSRVFADQVGLPIVQGIVVGLNEGSSALVTAIQTTAGLAITGAQAVVNQIGAVLSQPQLPQTARTVGQNIIDNLANALENHTLLAMPKLNATADNVINTLTNTLKNNNLAATAKGLGSNVISGVMSGIDNKIGAAVDKMRASAQKMLDAITNKLDIQSPSGVFANEVGVPIVMGLIQGLNDTWPLVTHWLKGNMAKTVAEFLKSSASLTRGAYNIFTSLKDLQSVPPFQPLIDATDSLKASQQSASKVSNDLLDLNAQIAAVSNANSVAGSAEEHVKNNQKLMELYAKQAQLLQDQAVTQGELTKLSNQKSIAEFQSIQQQTAIEAIANDARLQYQALMAQVNTMMKTDAKGALEMFNLKKSQIEELAQLQKERALSSNVDDQAMLDTQIRLLQAAQSAEMTAQNVTAQIQINPSGQSDQKIIDIIQRALHDAGIAVDVRTRTA